MRSRIHWLYLLLLAGIVCGGLAGCGSGGSSALGVKTQVRSVSGAAVHSRLKNPPTITSVVRKQGGGYSAGGNYFTWVVNEYGDSIGEFESSSVPTGDQIMAAYPDLFSSGDSFSQPYAAVTYEHWEGMNLGPVAGFEFY